MIEPHSWQVYFGFLVAPFVQEDVAVFSSASAASLGLASPGWAFAVALLGLTLSDTWKYWVGRLAAKHSWARRIAAKPKAIAAREQVLKHLVPAMFVARFVPGTRVPLYLAAGLFAAPFRLFLALVVASGALYLGAAFALVAAIGELAGRDAALFAPLIALAAVGAAIGGRALLQRLRPRPA